ncbi:MAG TPA: ABC transporter substrate-binding protein [Candidatus Cryosericum sp.]|nr:ABC transporter substrate-binding protein [Candidatus Cryosericum sp.]
MKKLISILLVIALVAGLGVGAVAPQAAAAETKEMFLMLPVGLPYYVLNGVQQKIDAAPEIVNGRTFVPIRLISETFGADVAWDNASRTVTIKLGSTNVVLKVGSTTATVNGKSYTLDAAAYIRSGRTMVPIRFISEALGLSVQWEPQKKLVYISAKPTFNAPGVTDKEVLIGSFAALSGAVSVIGVPFYHGFQAYINYVNDNGGVNGRKIKVNIADDQMNPALTVPAVKKFVEEDKVFAVVAGLGTPGCLAVMDYLNTNKVPFVYQGSGVSAIAYPPKNYVFAVQPNYTTEGQIFTKFAMDNNWKNVAVLYSNDDAGNEGKGGIEAGAKKFGANIVYESPFPVTETDFTSYLMKVKDSGADALLVYTINVALAGNIVKTAKSLGLTQKIILDYSMAGIAATAGAAAEGVYVTGWIDFSDANDPGVKKFYDVWLKYYPKDNPLTFAYAVAGYAAGEIFVEALRRAGQYPSRDALVWALETFNGWNGDVVKDISYGPNERAGKYSMFFMQVKNNQLVKVSGWVSVLQKP